MKIGSLFSGIGGLELGLEWSGLGETTWQVESDPFCRGVLARHWPHAARYEDVKAVGSNNLGPVDLICGGFPCQDVSSAGKRAGLAGARSGLWFEFHRVVLECKPRWVVVENVNSGARLWVDAVLQGLGGLGYACLPIPLAAADVGASHERRRIFVVATDTNARSEHVGAEHAEMASAQTFVTDTQQPRFAGWWTTQPDMVRVVHGLPRGLDTKRRRALGNAVVPQCAEVIGHVIQLLERT